MQAPRRNPNNNGDPQDTTVQESLYAADIAEQLLPGGAGLVQGLVRAEREVLRGLSELVDANVDKLERLEASIGDPERPRYRGSVGRGLLYLAVKRVAAVHSAISRFESAFLHGLAASVLGPPGEGAAAPPRGKTERVKIE